MNKLKRLRAAKGLSQERLAELAGTSQPQITRLEHDANHKDFRPMSVRWAQRLAPFLGCNPLDLLPLQSVTEKLPKMQSVNDSDTDQSYGGSAGREQPEDQEGKDVTPDAVLLAIGQLTVEIAGIKAEMKEIRAHRADPRPKKAQRK